MHEFSYFDHLRGKWLRARYRCQAPEIGWRCPFVAIDNTFGLSGAREASALSEGLGIGTLPNAPRHQSLADCELAAEAHDAHPQQPVTNGSDTDNARQPTRSAHRDKDSREARPEPHEGQQAANDTDRT